jgi:phage gp36-like protein
MAYATPRDFIEKFGINETAQLLSDDRVLIDAAALDAAVADPVVLPADATDAENMAQAVANLAEALAQTALEMNSYFSERVPLPLAAQVIAANPVKICNLDLARCELMDDDDNASERAEKRCEKWMTWLNRVASGRVKMTPPDSGDGSASAGSIRYGKTESAICWDDYPGQQGR